MRQFFKCATLAFLIMMLLSLNGQTADNTKTKSLKKPAKTIDAAIGLLDAGKVQHAVFNDGRLSTWDYRPKVPAVFYKGWSYIPDLSMMVGVPEDAAWTPFTTDLQTGKPKLKGPTVSATFAGSEWGPKLNSLGELHSGDMTFGEVLEGTTLGDYPLMATSVYPKSWPKDASGHPFWPGIWALNPQTGQLALDTAAVTEFDLNNPTKPWKYAPFSKDTILVGNFFSDKEIFFSMTDYDPNNIGVPYSESDGDTTQGYMIGLQLDISALSYGRSYAEDILFFPMHIINNSKHDYHDMYVGFYNDSDVPEYNLTTTLNDRMDWMTFIKSEYDVEKDTTYQYNMSFIYDFRYGKGNFPGPEYKVIPAVKLLETPKAPRDIDLNDDGTTDIRKGEQLGITGWHWFEWEKRPGQVDNTRLELVTYKLIAGDTSGLKPEELAAYFWPAPDGTLNTHFDSPEGIQTDFPDGTDCVYIMSSGPFDLAAGDTTTFSFGIILGDDINDAKFNARTAQFMYELNYQGADPPPTPTVWAVPGDKKITLYWNRAAEYASDLMTGYRDFEGYKIYRTTSPPVNNAWGQKVFDGTGLEVGFMPMAQFDLNNSVSGLDPAYPHLNLGSNNGIVHSFVDSNLTNGKTYWYAVTAYDRGVRPDPVLNPNNWAPLNSLECAKGTNPVASPNLVEVVPGTVPSDFKAPELNLARQAGTLGNGKITPRIFDQFKITGHEYEIAFDDVSIPGRLLYHVKDLNTNQYVLRNASETNAEEGQFFDGVQLKVESFQKIANWPDSTRWRPNPAGATATCTWQIIVTPGQVLPADYEIRFTAAGSQSFNKIQTPFEVWNVTTGKQINYFEAASAKDSTAELKAKWNSGDQIAFLEDIKGRSTRTWSVTLVQDSLRVISKGDTIYIHNPPKTGDIVQVVNQKPFYSGDRFVLNTSPFDRNSVAGEMLDLVKVVPNPYIVSAEWELDPNYKQLNFTHLPTVCDIHIYTLSGEKIVSLHHENETSSTKTWNMLSFNQQEVAYGLYIYVVETPNGSTKVGKFVILR